MLLQRKSIIKTVFESLHRRGLLIRMIGCLLYKVPTSEPSCERKVKVGRPTSLCPLCNLPLLLYREYSCLWNTLLSQMLARLVRKLAAITYIFRLP